MSNIISRNIYVERDVGTWRKYFVGNECGFSVKTIFDRSEIAHLEVECLIENGIESRMNVIIYIVMKMVMNVMMISSSTLSSYRSQLHLRLIK